MFYAEWRWRVSCHPLSRSSFADGLPARTDLPGHHQTKDFTAIPMFSNVAAKFTIIKSYSGIDPVVAEAVLAEHQRLVANGRSLLSADGVQYLQEMVAGGVSNRPQPRWDREQRRLWLKDELIKEFRQPAENQTTLLDAFERNGWPEHVSEPLPKEQGEREDEATLRLQETIKNLNRGLSGCAGNLTIRFRGDGTGKGAWWDIVIVPTATQKSPRSYPLRPNR